MQRNPKMQLPAELAPTSSNLFKEGTSYLILKHQQQLYDNDTARPDYPSPHNDYNTSSNNSNTSI